MAAVASAFQTSILNWTGRLKVIAFSQRLSMEAKMLFKEMRTVLASASHKPICSCLLCLIAVFLACVSGLAFASTTTAAYSFYFVLKYEKERRKWAFSLHKALT